MAEAAIQSYAAFITEGKHVNTYTWDYSPPLSYLEALPKSKIPILFTAIAQSTQGKSYWR
jgi:hypothetical protein